MKKGDKVGIVCCSNGLSRTYAKKINALKMCLTEIGLVPVFSEHIFEKHSVFSGTAEERAGSLMQFYQDDMIRAIFDISGGDLANEILPYLDMENIARSEKMFWGYSDLTTVINAIYARTGRPSVLYQIRNLILEHHKDQTAHFINTIFDEKEDLFSFDHQFVQKEAFSGIVVGGNIRCFLKLAGTPYFPDMHDKILLLESYSGSVPQIVAYLNQLKQMDVFDQICGILLGTFTEMEARHCVPTVIDLVRSYVGADMPIAQTLAIGHGSDSKAIVIGKPLDLSGRERK